MSTLLLLKDELDKSTILQAFRSEELNPHCYTTQAESLNQANTGSRRGKGNNWFKKLHKDTLQSYKDMSHKDPPKNYSQILYFICQELSHMLHNCPRVQDRKVVKGLESAKKADVEKTAAVTEFAGQASAIAEHEVNFTSSNIFH